MHTSRFDCIYEAVGLAVDPTLRWLSCSNHVSVCQLQWQRMKAAGPAPGPRASFTMAHHRHRAIMFGGITDQPGKVIKAQSLLQEVVWEGTCLDHCRSLTATTSVNNPALLPPQ